MSCLETENLLHAYVDGELDLVRALEIERHLVECLTCGQSHRNQLALRSEIRSCAAYYKAPERLRRRINAAVRQQEEADLRGSHGRSLWSVRWPVWALPTLAACLAVIALVGWYDAVLIKKSPKLARSDVLTQEILASHIRSLMANHLTDVPSSDRHTVRPWFGGKLDFSPPVEDLSSQGFPLLGGRLDYMDGRPVAALVYQRRKHFINLFVWPQATESRQELITKQGYHLLHWSAAGMTFWAVSDVDEPGLQAFVTLFQHRLLPSP